MSVSVPQVSWDNRPVIAKRRRAELYRFLDHLGIAYPSGAPKTKMIELLEANGIDINQPHEFFQWKVIHGKDENGFPHQHYEPITEPHETARMEARGQSIDYDKIIEERAEAKAEAEKSAELADAQAKMILALEERLKALEDERVPFESMTVFQLQSVCRRLGLKYRKNMTKADLLGLLDG